MYTVNAYEKRKKLNEKIIKIQRTTITNYNILLSLNEHFYYLLLMVHTLAQFYLDKI